ncbi:MAG: YbhB/YbcL family Raf kinase inhibitor-like protein [Bradymonadales bacterium]|nr:YbhB/YbcL family Raf kinase inhibitor-like protein [Bradymonadales bacterium]
MTISVQSSAFGLDQQIPVGYTGDGEDLSPPLMWSGAPEGTVEWALICDDPDAPRAEPWVHWVVYGIPASVERLDEGIPPHETLTQPTGARQGTNDFGRIGYGGPAPPRGHGRHHYYFTLYALDTPMALGPGATKRDLVATMEGHILDRGSHMGWYERP